jgi:hypothetical protein
VYAHLLDGEEQAQRTRDMLEAMLGNAIRDGASTTMSTIDGG